MLLEEKNAEKTLMGYGSVERIWNVSRTKTLKMQQEVLHEGLKEHKVISAPDIDILKNKVRVQADKWIEKWNVVHISTFELLKIDLQ